MYCPKLHSTLIVLLALCAVLPVATSVRAQGKQAVVIMRAPGGGATVTDCDGATEVNFLLVGDLKLNGKDEVRLLGSFGATDESAGVPRKTYEDAAKAKLKDLSSLKWDRKGLLYAVSVNGQQPMLALPDGMKPQKNTDPALSSFYAAVLSGEAREGKQKRKVDLPLRDIWKIYFTAEGVSANDALFNHAVEEKSVVLWEAFARKTGNYRANDANNYMRDALMTCAATDLDHFTSGDYGALDKARQRTGRAQSVRDDDGTRQLLLRVNQAQERVNDLRGQVDQLIRASKWDEAITAAEPIKVYLNTWPELNSMYTHALKQSHEIHVFKGQEAMQANQLEAAREHYTIAWQRLPDSTVAHAGVCESRDRIALRDAHNFRQQKRPKDAKELLERQLADADCTRDDRLVKDLSEANCEYAQQLYAEARQLIAAGSSGVVRASVPAAPAATRGPRRRGALPPTTAAPPPAPSPSAVAVKAINAADKKDFRDAHAKLVLAGQLCPNEQFRALLDAANHRLSEFCLEEARKAVQRGDMGTAYVYLQTANQYTPNDGTVLNALGQAREQFEARTRVGVGVVLTNSGGSDNGIVGEISSEIEGVATEAGLDRAIVLDHEQAAAALRGIQGTHPLTAPTVIFFGELLRGSVRRTDTPRTVRSSYQYENPDWKEADRVHDARNADYKNCRKQPGADCSGLEAEVVRLRANRDRLQHYITQYYTYNENLINITGELRLSFRAVDSISRSMGAVDMLTASVQESCVERSGVRREDGSASDASCNHLGGENNYLGHMVNEVKGEAHAKAYAQLRALPLSYYARARAAVSRPQAVEDYLRFLFLTRDKNGNEAQEALRFLLAFDPELTTDGVLR